MARDGSGNYTLPLGINPVQPNTVIATNWANPTLNDIAAALTQSIAADGQTTVTSNLPMNNHRHTGCLDPAARNQYATLGLVQDNKQAQVLLQVGSTNNLLGDMAYGALTAYSPGMVVWFKALGDNTTAVTLNINGVGAKSVLARGETELAAGDLTTGDFYSAYYDDSIGAGAWVLMSDTSGQSYLAYQNIITGWDRPAGGTYPAINVTVTDVTIPSGSGIIVPPVISAGTPIKRITWAGGTFPLSHVTTASSTTLAIDVTGNLVQIAGRPSPAYLRDSIIIGYITHPGAQPPAAVLAPAIRFDNNYVARDTTYLLSNNLVSGGRLSQNAGNNLALDVTAGFALNVGANSSVVDDPNVLTVAGGSAVNVMMFGGTLDSNYAAPAPTVDVSNYDPNYAVNGPLVALAAGEWTFHRVYDLYGYKVVVYGQYKYAASDAVEALSFYPVDNGRFSCPVLLQDAVYLGALLVTTGITQLDGGTAAPHNQGVILSKGSTQFGINTAYSSGFNDAPADGNTYGRRNNNWSTTIAANNPIMTGDAVISGNDSRINIQNTTAAGLGGLRLLDMAGVAKATVMHDPATDIVYFDSYDALSVLVSRWSWDLATGTVQLVAGSTIGGVPLGTVVGPPVSTTGNVPTYDDTTGRVLNDGRTIQSVADDATAGRLLQNGSWGLGAAGGLITPSGTTAQRDATHTGVVRYNTTLSTLEWRQPAGDYASIPLIAPGAISGFAMTTPAGFGILGYETTTFTVGPGYANSVVEVDYARRGVRMVAPMTKTFSAWSAGNGGGALASSLVGAVGNYWLGVFLLWGDAGTVDIGLDSSLTANNLRTVDAPTLQNYRRIGWVKVNPAGTQLRSFTSDGDGNFHLRGQGESGRISVSGNQTGLTINAGGAFPPLALVDFQVTLYLPNALSAGDVYALLYNTTEFSGAQSAIAQIENCSVYHSSATDTVSRTLVRKNTVRNVINNHGEVRLSITPTSGATYSYEVSASSWHDDRISGNT